MNFVDILKKRFMDDWTGGASGKPNRYHGREAFEDFELRDVLQKNRWATEGSGRNPRSDRPEFTSYYHPRPTGESMRSYMEDQRREPIAFPMGNSPMVTGSGLNAGFQDWSGKNPQGRAYDMNPNPENTTRTTVQDKNGIKETVVTKTPNPETSMIEIIKRMRELIDARSR